jgi:4-alpha-glucanotransferase
VRHRDDGYRLFADSIRRNLKHGGALRIDHVMRFFRLYWIPEGHEATDGTYVRENHEDLLRILALESVRNQVIIVGEDLGTVEPYIRENLHRFGILSYRLLYFERDQAGKFNNPEQYPHQALISVSTHDLPTLAGFWTNRDIEARRAAGLLHDHRNYEEQIRARDKDKQQLLDVLFDLHLLPDSFPRRASDIPEFTGELHNAVVAFLAKSSSELMCMNQEDLLKDLDQQNLPGSTEQYPNWRHKMRFTLEELTTDPFAKGCAEMFKYWVRRTGRYVS